MRRRKNATLSYSSPRGSSRACLCPDGRTYSTKCCDGTLEAQGIGSIHKTTNFMLQEDRSFILQENNSKIIL
jgi:hypothetical protein